MPQQNQNGDPTDILSEVSLVSFTANPPAIGPFGASVLSWRVTGPTSGFQVELNQQIVVRSGEQVVQPTNTTTYQLTANARGVSELLGSVQVAVDRSSCQINPGANALSTIQGPIYANITGDLSFRDGSSPVVTFSQGRIRIQLHLSKHIDVFPNPDVDIDASFGLTVHDAALQVTAIPDRVLQATGELISVDISEPEWVWLLPGAPIGLAIALDGGKRDAHKKMHELIQGIVELLNFYYTPPHGFRRQSVRIDVDNNGAGIIETTECPSAVLQQSVAISQVNTPPVLE